MSIGLEVPVDELFDADGILLGLFYTVPAVLGKFVTGGWVLSRQDGSLADAMVVGWAMVGRGELGFVMAQEARDEGLFSDRPFVASVWALLLATLLSPFATRWALMRRAKPRPPAESSEGRH